MVFSQKITQPSPLDRHLHDCDELVESPLSLTCLPEEEIGPSRISFALTEVAEVLSHVRATLLRAIVE